MKNGLNNVPLMAVPVMTIMVGAFKCRCQLPYNMTAATWEWLPIVFRLTVNAPRPSLSPSTSPTTSLSTSLLQLPIAFFLSVNAPRPSLSPSKSKSQSPIAYCLLILSFAWLSIRQSHHYQQQHHNRLNVFLFRFKNSMPTPRVKMTSKIFKLGRKFHNSTILSWMSKNILSIELWPGQSNNSFSILLQVCWGLTIFWQLHHLMPAWANDGGQNNGSKYHKALLMGKGLINLFATCVM